MALPSAIRQWTSEDYLALERAAEARSELIDGEIVAITGASRKHNVICLNLGAQLNLKLHGRPCETYASDMRVKVAEGPLYTYPDLVVVCGEPRFEDADLDTLLNPTVLVEILSPTTEAYDRGAKFARYRRLESLRAYVLVSQDRPQVEHFVRRGKLWEYSAAEGIDASFSLASLDVALALRDVYDRIDFAAEADETKAEPSSGA